jgi:hypothetical protein
VGQGIGVSLPIVVVPHPVGDRDEALITKRGAEIAAECVRVLTTSPESLAREFEDRQYPLPGVMPR